MPVTKEKVLASVIVAIVILLSVLTTSLTNPTSLSGASAVSSSMPTVWYVFCGTSDNFSITQTITVTLSSNYATNPALGNESGNPYTYFSNHICHTNHWIAVDSRGLEVAYVKFLGVAIPAQRFQLLMGLLILAIVAFIIIIVAMRRRHKGNRPPVLTSAVDTSLDNGASAFPLF